MGILKRAGDLLYTFRFLTLLVTPFDKTKAFEEGKIIPNYPKGSIFYRTFNGSNSSPHSRSYYNIFTFCIHNKFNFTNNKINTINNKL